MLRRAGLLYIVVCIALATYVSAVGQSAPTATTSARINMRLGPDKSYPAVTILTPGTTIILEARTTFAAWLLVHTENSAFRGWIVNQHLAFAPGFDPMTLPVSSEIVNASNPGNPPPAPANPTAAPKPPQADKPVEPNKPAGAINLPRNSASVNQRIRAIYQRGRQLGNKPNVYIRFGDSIIAYHLMHAFADRSAYSLGPYSYLQTTVDFFRASHNDGNLTAATGFNMASVLDPTWANPQFCKPGENLLACEVRIKKPSIALIYLGPNDMHDYPLRNFVFNTDQVVQQLIDLGVIPVLYTFAVRADRLPEVYPGFIRAIRDAAARQRIPLIEFHEAAKSLPDNGVVQDAFHMTHREDWSIHFTGDEKVYGETLLELMTLHTLDDIRRNAIR